MKRRLLMLSMILIFCFGSQVLAAKGGKGGGGGGGTDDEVSTVYDLVKLAGVGETRSAAYSISNTALDGSTYVSGVWLTNGGSDRPCLWRVNVAGEVAETVDLSLVLDLCEDVNCRGMVAGSVYDGVQYTARVAFADGNFFDLGVNAQAIALTDPDENNIVRVVGSELIDPVNYRGTARQWDILVSENTTELICSVDLADYGLADYSPRDCNNLGDIVGYVHPGGAVVASWTAQGTLAFEFLGDFSPEAIDDAGNVVGYKQVTNPGTSEGIVVAPDGTVTNLTLATGKETSHAFDVAVVNGITQVVGQTIYASLWSGYLWTNSEMMDVNRLAKVGGGHLGRATGINTSGAICGRGRFSRRGVELNQGYLLIPNTK